MAERRRSTRTLYHWNGNNADRMPTFHADQRFDREVMAARSCNQHSSKSLESEFEDAYRWLIGRTEEVASTPAGHFRCWVPGGPGIQHLASGYSRFSFRGVYHMCHAFTWHYRHPGDQGSGDLSHLCSNQACCRPSHLHREDRNTNLSRRGCPGYLVSTTSNLVLQACRHDPPCTVTTPFNETCDAVPLNFEP